MLGKIKIIFSLILVLGFLFIIFSSKSKTQAQSLLHCGNGIWDIGEDINNCPADANSYSLGPTAPPQKVIDNYEIGMYVFPNWHNYLKNPDGTTVYNLAGVWSTIRNATTVFPGQDQPKMPLLNYYDDSNPVAADWMIKWGTDSGVDFFVYDWYYDNNGIKRQEALEQGFLKSKYINDTKFAVMWANHLAVDQTHADEAVDYVVNNYFSLPQYYKVNGKPVFYIWDLRPLINTFSRSGTKAIFDSLRNKSIAKGYGGAEIILVKGGYLEETAGFSFGDMATVGIDGLTDYTYLLRGMTPNSTREYTDAIIVNENSWIEYYDKMVGLYGTNPKYFPVIAPGYDDYPLLPWRINYKTVINSTPEKFQKLVQRAKNFVDTKNINPKIIMVEAWDEWSEGAVMAPTKKWGTRYIEAINRGPLVFSKTVDKFVSSSGSILTYTINYENLGNNLINNAVITDIVPANTTLDSIQNNGQLIGNTVRWTVPSILSGASGTVSFRVIIN